MITEGEAEAQGDYRCIWRSLNSTWVQ